METFTKTNVKLFEGTGYCVFKGVYPEQEMSEIKESLITDLFGIFGLEQHASIENLKIFVDQSARKEFIEENSLELPRDFIWRNENSRTPMWSKSCGMVNLHFNPFVHERILFDPRAYRLLSQVYDRKDLVFVQGPERISIKPKGSVATSRHIDSNLFYECINFPDRVQALICVSIDPSSGSKLGDSKTGGLEVLINFHRYWEFAQQMFHPQTGIKNLRWPECHNRFHPWPNASEWPDSNLELFRNHIRAYTAYLYHNTPPHPRDLLFYANLKEKGIKVPEEVLVVGWQEVPCQVGDLVCWSQHTPHRNCSNNSEVPRIVCYYSVFPVESEFYNSETQTWVTKQFTTGVAHYSSVNHGNLPTTIINPEEIEYRTRTATWPKYHLSSKLAKKLCGLEEWNCCDQVQNRLRERSGYAGPYRLNSRGFVKIKVKKFKKNKQNNGEWQNEYTQLLATVRKEKFPAVCNLCEVKYTLTYNEGQALRLAETLNNLHIGQRKLFGVELRFLTKFLSSLQEKAFVVYAGSSPSLHLHYLSTLFPCVKFLLVDPAQTILRIGRRNHLQALVEEVLYLRTTALDTIFVKALCADGKTRRKQRREIGVLDNKLCIDQFFKGKQSIYIFEEYFDLELAQLIRDCAPASSTVLFWSDIRTNLDEKDHPEPLDIAWNLAQQLNWVRTLQPDTYLLKFKHVFFNQCTKEQFLVRSKQPPYVSAIESCGVDFASPLLTYLKGEIWLQPFSRAMSAETRLVGVKEKSKDPYPLTEYDPREYESRTMFFNAIERGVCSHHNPLLRLGVGYDDCGDCAYEAKLWMEYQNKLDPHLDLKVAIQDLGVVTRGLENHGKGATQKKHTKKV